MGKAVGRVIRMPRKGYRPLIIEADVSSYQHECRRIHHEQGRMRRLSKYGDPDLHFSRHKDPLPSHQLDLQSTN